MWGSTHEQRILGVIKGIIHMQDTLVARVTGGQCTLLEAVDDTPRPLSLLHVTDLDGGPLLHHSLHIVVNVPLPIAAFVGYTTGLLNKRVLNGRHPRLLVSDVRGLHGHTREGKDVSCGLVARITTKTGGGGSRGRRCTHKARVGWKQCRASFDIFPQSVAVNNELCPLDGVVIPKQPAVTD